MAVSDAGNVSSWPGAALRGSVGKLTFADTQFFIGGFRETFGTAAPSHYLPIESFLHSGYSIEPTNFCGLDFGFTETTVKTLGRLHADLGKRPEVIWR